MNAGKLYGLMAAVVVLFSAGHTFGAAVTIDSFNKDQTETASSGSSFSEVQEGVGEILGEYRDLQVEIQSNPEGTDYVARVDFSDSDNISIASDPQVDGKTTLQWDGNDNSASLDTAGFSSSPKDLEDGGINDRINVGVISADSNSNVTFNVYSMSGGNTFGSTLSKDISTTTEFLFDEFAQISGTDGEADFSQVTAVEMIVDTAANGDVTLDFVESNTNPVPAPAAFPAGLALLGGMGLIRRRRMQRRAA